MGIIIKWFTLEKIHIFSSIYLIIGVGENSIMGEKHADKHPALPV
jgi:hypothetical protein